MNRPKTNDELRQEIKQLRAQLARLQKADAEQKKAKERLRLTQFSVDQASDATFWIEADARFRYVNRRACTSLGYSCEELLSMTAHDIDPVFTKDKWPEHWNELKEKGSLCFESVHHTKSGETFPVEISANYIEFAGKEYNCAFARDITERKWAESKIVESEKQLSAILNNMQDTYYRTDIHGVITMVSPSIEQASGYTPEEVIGARMSSFYVNPDERELLLKKLMENGGKVSNFETLMKRNDGSTIWASTSAKFLMDEKGNVIGVEGTSRDITERKRVEEELRFTQFSVDSNSLEIYWGDKDARIIYANDSACRNVGYSQEEFLTKKVFDFVLGLSPDNWPKLWETLKQERSIPYEAEHRRKDGSTYPAEYTLNYLEYGGKEFIVATASNITERKRAENELQRSRRNISAILKTVGEGIVTIDTDSHIQFVNQELLDIFGYSSEELIGQHIHILMPEKYRAAHAAGLARYLEGAPAKALGKRLEMKGLRKEGSDFPLEIRINETRIDGKHRLFTAAIRDISERKKAELELSRLYTAIENAAETIVITDTQGTIQYCNPAFLKTTGYTREKAIGQNPSILKSGEHDEAFYKELWDTITRGEVWQGRFINRKKNGELYEEDSTISPIMDPSGTIHGYVAIKRDVTREVMLEKQVQQAQKMEAIGTLAGGVAHDFNNILTAIIGFTEIAADSLPDDSEAREDLHYVLDAGARAKELVKQILAFSRQADKELQPVQPHLIVKESLKLLRASIPATIELKTDIDTSAGEILADATQISQVIMNLCTNAGYVMRQNGGVLEVSLKRIEVDKAFASIHQDLNEGEYIRLTVSDTGVGIETETLKRIFDPFFTTKPKGEGTGMGLSVVHGIVTGMGGAINVDSEVGRGTTVTVYLPRIEKRTEFTKEAVSPIRGGSETVLLVDDEQTIVLMLTKILEELGYTVTPVTNATEALDIFKASTDRFDIVVTDQTMPGMTGAQFAMEVIALRKDIPVVLCTGYSFAVNEEEARRMGVREFIMKPVTKRTIAEVIRRALDSSDTVKK